MVRTEELFELYAHQERGKNVGCQVPDISSPPDRRQILSAADVDEFFFCIFFFVWFYFPFKECNVICYNYTIMFREEDQINASGLLQVVPLSYKMNQLDYFVLIVKF